MIEHRATLTEKTRLSLCRRHGAAAGRSGEHGPRCLPAWHPERKADTDERTALAKEEPRRTRERICSKKVRPASEQNALPAVRAPRFSPPSSLCPLPCLDLTDGTKSKPVPRLTS